MYISNEKFLKVIKILLLQSQIFGLITFDYGEKKFRSSKNRNSYNFALIFIFSSFIAYCIYKIVTVVDGPGVIYRTTDVLILVVNGCYMCTIWVCAIIHREDFITFLQRILDFDSKIQNYNNIKYENQRRRILKGMIIRYLILFFLITFLATYAVMHINCHEIVADSLSYFLMVINSAFCHQTTEFILALKERFSLLNRQIKKLIVFFTRNIKTIEKDKFLPLNKICALHHHLTKQVKLFNEIFGLILLLMFGVSFVTIVLSLFYCAAELQSSKIKWLKLIWALLSSVSFILDTVYVCDVCYGTIEEAKRAGELIHKIETEDCIIRDEIEMFSLQIANEQVEFNASGFFPVNFTLLFSIIGGVTTYIIILIQLSATLSDNN